MKKNNSFYISDYRICENCIHSSTVSEGELIICKKHGLKNADHECRHFEIDLLSVTPRKLRTIKSTLSEEDFKL